MVHALVRTMEKTHHGKGLSIKLDVPEQGRFRGERQDLEEMVGNLVDNACKWAQSRVAIEVTYEVARALAARVRIVVDDDGRGLTPSEREQVARRGRRLDETKPGSGLGLSIVVELAALYGGGITLGNRADRRFARRTPASGGLTDNCRNPCCLVNASRVATRP